MKRSVVIFQGLQVAVACLALWVLYDVKASNKTVEFTWLGVVLPCGLFALHCSGVLTLKLKLTAVHRQSAFIVLTLLPIAGVVLWWITLFVADANSWCGTGNGHNCLRLFFIRSGRLQPNEIFGSSWPLFVYSGLQSIAALLGIIPLAIVWFDSRRSHSAN